MRVVARVRDRFRSVRNPILRACRDVAGASALLVALSAGTAVTAATPGASPLAVPAASFEATRAVPIAREVGAAVRSLPGTGDAFYAGVKTTPRQWTRMRDGQTIRAALAAHPEFTIYGNPAAITTAWSGGARRGAKFWGMGGGHYDCSFNGVYEVDLETGKTSIPIAPSRITPAQLTAIQESWKAKGGGWLGYSQMGIWPKIAPDDGLGPAIHTYQMAYVGADGSFALAGRRYDMTTGKTATISANGSANANGAYWGKNYVGTNWAAGYWDVTVVDTTQWTSKVVYLNWPYRGGAGANFNFDARTYITVVGNTLHAIKTSVANPEIWKAPIVWKVALPMAETNNTDLNQPTFTGSWSAEDMDGLQATTQVLDPETDTLYIPAKDWSYFLTWEPLKNRLGKVVLTGGMPPSQTNAAYGRLQWYVERGVITLINSIDEPVYAVSVK